MGVAEVPVAVVCSGLVPPCAQWRPKHDAVGPLLNFPSETIVQLAAGNAEPCELMHCNYWVFTSTNSTITILQLAG